jgi:molybdenum cofactor biosynthesis protein A
MRAPLVDGFGRVHTDLRLSLTDRCNLRCTYCMPAEGLDWLPKPELLTDDELVRLAGVFASMGVRTVRLTGGEPLLRRGLPGLVARLSGLGLTLSLTTNGVGLERQAQALRDAGLRRVNVSLDSLRPERFAALTLRDRHADVLRGLAAAQAAGLEPVKVNTVLMRGVNDDEAGDLLEWALAEGYALRFIEQMPLDPQHGWDRGTMVDADEILAVLGRSHRLTPGRDPGQRAGRGVPRRRRTRHGRRRRLGQPALLRRLRPAPAHRRRSGPQLPVRPRRVRPPGAAARRRVRRRAGRAPARRGRHQEAGPRHRRPGLRAAGPSDERHRRLTQPRG